MTGVINAADPVLSIVSMQGRAMQEVEKQTSCQIEVLVSGDHYGKPIFELPPQVKIIREGVSKSFSMIKGGMSQTTTYGYTVLFSDVGTYSIGPVTINTPQGEKKSNPISIRVVSETKKADGDYAGFFTVLAKKLYEGDIVPLRLQIIIDPVNIQRIDVPHISHDHINQVKPWNLQYRDVKKVNDQQMLCQEWVTEIQCTKAGTYEFPITSLKAIIGSGFFMSMFATQTSIAIKPLIIECLPLPLYNGQPVSLLGNIRSIETRLSGSSIELGKALTLDLTINYDTRCLVKEIPTFTMPESVNCYFSQEHNEPHKKILSYIIHPTREGSYSISSQKISFFNSIKDEVGAVLTMPLSFKVKPGIAPAGIVLNKTEDERLSIPAQPFELSIFGLWFFTLLPLVIQGIVKAFALIRDEIRRRNRVKRLLRILKSDAQFTPIYLYENMEQLLKAEQSMSLIQLLEQLHFSSEAIDSAQKWWEYLVRQRFAPRDQHNNELTMIIKQWVERYG